MEKIKPTSLVKEEDNMSERASEDYRLVQKAVAGDQKAYSMLLERYRDSVFNMMFKMVYGRDDAEDLTLEAFGKAFRKLDSYTPNFAFSTWLYKIAINNAIDFIRKRRIRLLSIDESIDSNGGKQDFASQLNSDSLDPEQKYIQVQRVKLMQNVICKLNPKYRLMIEMRYFEECSYQEIAMELNIPLGTVKAQLFRAKELLQNLLKESETGSAF